MTFGDQGVADGQPDPCVRSAAERERIRRRRRGRRAARAGACVVFVATVAAGAVVTAGGDDGGDPASAAPAAPATSGPAVPSVDAGLPSAAPSALASLLARPVIRPEQAFPRTIVRLEDGSRYTRVDLATTTDCSQGTSVGPAELVGQGEECSRLTAALFTDTAERRTQITVTVLSFARVEDASRVFARASADPATYRVVPLDPPPEAGLPTAPPGSSAGVVRRLTTVRSVVFANGRWTAGAETGEAETGEAGTDEAETDEAETDEAETDEDGTGEADTGEAELVARTEALLRHVHGTVAAYEREKG
ncbi:hypothetical protein [Streptomyces sp. NPDC059894]|uniref:hypothetical protein n=1 Tax=unclassified Streptomyces TaxID=2593676 RepID=UPI003655B045